MNTSADTKKPYIVAPAGSRECLSAALHAGADAVYLGTDDYNMRAWAKGFQPSDLPDIVSRAHDAGTSVYLTVNALAFDDELDGIANLLDRAAESGVDAVIAWDLGVMSLARERSLPLHLSTQASAANARAVAAYGALGVRRCVLARELSLPRIRRLVEQCRTEIPGMTFECFVHGAMCIAVSGRCFASWHHFGRSANRGDCLQPCRRSYLVTDERDGTESIIEGSTIMSARDLCTIDIVDRLIDSGMDAFKIEGRMRDALYVKTTVECYREARDAVLDGGYTPSLIRELSGRLKTVFNRGFSRGFYLSDPGPGDKADGDGNRAEWIRVYAGRVTNYYPRAGAADVLLEARGLARGERLLITGPTTGAVQFTAESMRSEDNAGITRATGGDTVGLAVPEKVRENDRVYVLETRE